MKRNNLLYFYLAVFVFIASLALVISNSSNPQSQISDKEPQIKEFSLTPVISENTAFPVVSAQAVLAVDTASVATLYEKDPDKKLLPASTTKIITALVAMDYYYDDQILEVKDIKVEGQKMGLVEGEKITVADLLNGLLVYSANDAAEVLAQNYGYGRDDFIVAMNLKARDLGLDNSIFTNPTGLDSNGDAITSTARDLIKVARVAMEKPEFAGIVGTEKVTVASVDGKITHKLANLNELLGKVPGVLGVKTGWTESARENLVTYVERDGHKIMIAVLGSQDRFGETRELIDWIFASYHWP